MQDLLKSWAVWGALSLCVVAGSAARAAVFTTDAFAWAAQKTDQTTFSLTANDLVKSDEITVAPTTNLTTLGPTLTFPSAATGVPTSFQLHSLTQWPWEYRNNVTLPFGPFGISAGNVQAQDGTDWEILFTAGEPVLGFGFNMIDQEASPDQVSVYHANGALLGTFTISTQHTFVGVTSPVPIARVVLDGDPVDYSAINGLRISALPEPTAATAVFVLVAAHACGRRGRGVARRS